MIGSTTPNLAFGHTSGVGKDALCALIIERGGHYRRALADAVKEELGCALLGIDLRMDGNRYAAWDFVESRKHLPAMRRMMQAYGDGKREMIAKTYWIDQVFGYRYRVERAHAGGAAQSSGLIIPDLRHLNEIQVFLEHEFVCIDIDRPDAPKLAEGLSGHVSETQLRPGDFPYQIVNDGTPAEMLALFDAVMEWHNDGGRPYYGKQHWPLTFRWARPTARPQYVTMTPAFLPR